MSVATFSKYSLVALIQLLLQAGLDIYDEDDQGRTVAADIGFKVLTDFWSDETVRELSVFLPMTRIIDSLDLSPVTKIILGLRQGDIRSCLANLPLGCSIHDLDGTGCSAIHWAALTGSKHALNELILFGADYEQRSSWGHTPLMSAVYALHRPAECVELLLQKGADPSADDGFLRTPFLLACGQRHSEVVEVFLQHGVYDTQQEVQGLHLAARTGYIDMDGTSPILSCLLNAGGDINCRDVRNLTPLMYAIRASSAEMCMLLLEAGADAGLSDDTGWTCLHWAAAWGDERTLQALYFSLYGKYRGLADALTDNGYTARMLFEERPWKTPGMEDAFRDLMNVRSFPEILLVGDSSDGEGYYAADEYEEVGDEETE